MGFLPTTQILTDRGHPEGQFGVYPRRGGALLRDPSQILGRWARFFSTLLNANSDNLDPDIAAEVPQQPTAHALGDEPAAEEVAAALRSMDN